MGGMKKEWTGFNCCGQAAREMKSRKKEGDTGPDKERMNGCNSTHAAGGFAGGGGGVLPWHRRPTEFCCLKLKLPSVQAPT